MAIGQKLEDARNRKGISIREASESTKIRGDFLTSFEAGNFDINLPEVYLRGFIRVYARFLGIDPESAVADLNMEIGSVKNKNAKKSIGKMSGNDSVEGNKELSQAESSRMVNKHAIPSKFSQKTLIFIGTTGAMMVLVAVILIIIFSSPENPQVEVSENTQPSPSTVRETNTGSTSQLDQQIITKTDPETSSMSKESTLKLAAIGPIERLIISDEGKSPKVFHEFKNIQLGWEKAIPFSKSFRCYSSSLQHIRFAVDDGIEKQVSGEGAGNFSWSVK
jgi:cytoskeletal protein RodZ